MSRTHRKYYNFIKNEFYFFPVYIPILINKKLRHDCFKFLLLCLVSVGLKIFFKENIFKFFESVFLTISTI